MFSFFWRTHILLRSYIVFQPVCPPSPPTPASFFLTVFGCRIFKSMLFSDRCAALLSATPCSAFCPPNSHFFVSLRSACPFSELHIFVHRPTAGALSLTLTRVRFMICSVEQLLLIPGIKISRPIFIKHGFF